MSFTQETFAPVGSETTKAPTVYSYLTSDTRSDLAVAGYFESKQEQLEEDNTIIAITSDGFGIFTVLADTASVVLVVGDISVDPNVVLIQTEQDWIDNTTDSGSNARAMLVDKVYFIAGTVSHAFTLQANGINRITSNTIIKASNDYTGVNTNAYEITNAGFGISFDNITINCPGKDWMISTAALFLSTDRCSIQASAMGPCNALIIFFAFTRFGNTGSEFTTGMSFSTTGNVSMDITNCAFFPDQGTSVSCVDLLSSTWGDVRIESTKFNLGTNNVALAGLGSGGNLISAGFVNHCDMTGATSAIDGPSPATDPWVFTGNLGVGDSTSNLGGFVEGNATATVIGVGAGDDGNPIVVNVGVLASSYEDERFTMATNGQITYTGTNDAEVSVLYTGIADAAAGNNVPYTFYVAVGGVVIPGSRSPVNLDSADPGRFAAQALVNAPTGETIDLFVEENTGTTNITISDFSVVVS